MKIIDLETSIATALQTQRFIMASDLWTWESSSTSVIKKPQGQGEDKASALKTPRKWEQVEAFALQVLRLGRDHSQSQQVVSALKAPKESTGCVLCPGNDCNQSTVYRTQLLSCRPL
jgi:hypothetical protein